MGYCKKHSNVGTAMHYCSNPNAGEGYMRYTDTSKLHPEVIRIADNIRNRLQKNEVCESTEMIIHRASKLYAKMRAPQLRQEAKNREYKAHVEMIEKKFPILSPMEKFKSRYKIKGVK